MRTIPCIICWRPVEGYEPEYCCDGFECGCHGVPINPCCCSERCEAAVFDHIGKPFNERRLLAGIEEYADIPETTRKKEET